MMWKQKPQEIDSSARVLNKFLLGAIVEGALGIKFEFKADVAPLRDALRYENKSIVASYYLCEEWKAQHNTPTCAQADLIAEIRRCAAMDEIEKAGSFALDLYGENGDLHLVCRITVEITSANAVTLYLVTSPET